MSENRASIAKLKIVAPFCHELTAAGRVRAGISSRLKVIRRIEDDGHTVLQRPSFDDCRLAFKPIETLEDHKFLHQIQK